MQARMLLYWRRVNLVWHRFPFCISVFDATWQRALLCIFLMQDWKRQRCLVLLRPRERLRSIVMSASVCVSVCLFVCLSVCLSDRIYPESHARSLPIFVHVAYVRGSVLLRQLDDRPHRLSPGRGFLPHWHCNSLAAKGIIRSLLRSLKMGSAGKGWRECTARAKCNLQLPCCTLCVLIITFRVRSVCLSVPRRIPTLLHGSGCNLGNGRVPSSCALLGGFTIGARVSLLWQHSGEREISASACPRFMPGSS